MIKSLDEKITIAKIDLAYHTKQAEYYKEVVEILTKRKKPSRTKGGRKSD